MKTISIILYILYHTSIIIYYKECYHRERHDINIISKIHEPADHTGQIELKGKSIYIPGIYHMTRQTTMGHQHVSHQNIQIFCPTQESSESRAPSDLSSVAVDLVSDRVQVPNQMNLPSTEMLGQPCLNHALCARDLLAVKINIRPLTARLLSQAQPLCAKRVDAAHRLFVFSAQPFKPHDHGRQAHAAARDDKKLL